jgi:hypothetical protein
MAKLKGKKLQAEINRLFKLHGNNVQFNIHDLGKISRCVELANDAGLDLDEAMRAAVAKYRLDGVTS